jgi:dTDP-glucose 4,6-dehydratase
LADVAGGHPTYRRLLVTGGAGFIGSCYVRDVLARRDGTSVTVLDKLTYAGNVANLEPVVDDHELAGRFRFVQGDIADPEVVRPLVQDVDAVVNFAAESHVDRSILEPEAFLSTGVIGVHVLLDACRAAAGRPRFLQVSTDEVYGSVAEGHATEEAPLAPRSPYAAAKAAGELLVRSYVVTHGVDAVVTRGSNTYGPYHHPEKLIPLFVTNALDDQPLPLYGDGLQRREWLYVAAGETYNVAGPTERTNREVVELLLERLGKPWSLVRHVEDRPGHDRRYAMDGSKLAALGWQPTTAFEDGLTATIDWYRANEAWWRAARSGDWDGWYERQYGRRLATGVAAGTAAAAGDAAPGADVSTAAPGPAD